MNYRELKKILRKNKVGGVFSRGLRLFDTEYAEVSFAEMSNRVSGAMLKLDKDGVLPIGWRDNGADCDNWAMWIMSEVTKQWAIDNAVNSNLASIPFGRAHVLKHDLNIGVADGEVYVWDYGRLKPSYDLKTISEAEFK